MSQQENSAVPPPVPDVPVALDEELLKLKRQFMTQLERFMARPEATGDPVARQAAQTALEALLAKEGGRLAEPSRKQRLAKAVMNELFDLGPIQCLLEDPTISEIMVNRADRVYVERNGRAARTEIVFDDDAHCRRIIDRIIVPLGRRLDADSPLVDARLPDGSRVNAVIPPVAIAGSCITIRKFSKKLMALEDLARLGTMTENIVEFLRASVLAKLNIVVTGGTSSGKTTLLNALSGCIPDYERIVTIEDSAELKLSQDHVITLEAKRPKADGTGEVTIRELVRNALRMRPERIVVGECRGAETLDMLQAMNTGHEGSLTTLHANTPRDALSRIETMSLMAGIDFPVRVIREQVGSAIQLLVHQQRMRDGSRKITYITEIAGMEGDKIVLQELFRYKENLTADGKSGGALLPQGLRPHFMAKLEAIGIKLPPDMFMPGLANGRARTMAA